MTILVTGAGGFVGLNVLERLLADGVGVVSFSRNPLDPAALRRFAGLPGSLTIIAGDVRDGEAMSAALRGHHVDGVVHMATVTAAAEREKRAAGDVIAVNLVGLANAMTAAAKAGVQRFVYTGSIAVFGPETPDGGLLDEDSPHDPRTLYAITKSAGEAVVARLGALHGLDWTIARLGRVFGPYEHDTGVRDTMSQIYQATALARAGGVARFARPCVKNWSYAPDCAADLALLATAATLPHRIYNLGTPHAFSLEDWCGRLKARMPDFSYVVGETGGDAIDLWGARDGSLLSWQRFEADYNRAAPHGLDAAFDGYMRFLDEAATVEQAV